MKNMLDPAFTRDELILMMLYNPGTREGLLQELMKMQTQLSVKDKELRGWTRSVLTKLQAMSDEEFDKLELL
jgi:hypothetical protein